jgi:hypothetical protein
MRTGAKWRVRISRQETDQVRRWIRPRPAKSGYPAITSRSCRDWHQRTGHVLGRIEEGQRSELNVLVAIAQARAGEERADAARAQAARPDAAGL